MRVYAILFAALALCGCSSEHSVSNLDALETQTMIMPNGQEIRAEVLIAPDAQLRGMMFRDALPEGRGMFFMHKEVKAYTYWMYNVKVPLDMIFIDAQHQVLGVVASAPPCTTRASECPNYGGFPGTKYVLELNGGQAAHYQVEPGRSIRF
jgi:uncharacterized protein